MENIIVDLVLMVAGVGASFVVLNACIGDADGGSDPVWARPVLYGAAAIFLLGGGLLAAHLIGIVRSFM